MLSADSGLTLILRFVLSMLFLSIYVSSLNNIKIEIRGGNSRRRTPLTND